MIALNKLTEIKYWMHRNAREVELSLWNYFFENGSRRDVADALSWYQNEDGGFGYALDADNWNPDSNPYQTSMAIRILRNIGFTDMEHPVCQGIFRYLYSEKDLMDYGWRFCIPTNDNFPHAPWWQYDEERNLVESIGPTCDIATFILKYMDPGSELYRKLSLIHIFTGGQTDRGGLTGSGCIVAVFDTGIDYSLPDFRDSAGSRILYLWDQTLAPDPERGFFPPEGFSVGVEFTQAQITEALEAGGEETFRRVPSMDISGHGTAVAAIAAGSNPNRCV